MTAMKLWVQKFWHIVTMCTAIVGAGTTWNVRMHAEAQKQIVESVRVAVREAMTDTHERLGRVEERAVSNSVAIAILRERVGGQ